MSATRYEHIVMAVNRVSSWLEVTCHHTAITNHDKVAKGKHPNTKLTPSTTHHVEMLAFLSLQ